MSQSLSVPLYFHSRNYAYWNVRIRAFIKSMDKLVWVSVQNGWTNQTTIIDGVVILIAIANWSRTNLNECN